MSAQFPIVLVVVFAATVFAVVALHAMRVWHRFHESMIVTCPETAQPAAVRVDARHAVVTALVDTQPALRLADCSRWESRGRCAEPCLSQVATDGESCRLTTIARRWYAGRGCVYCGKAISDDRTLEHHAALLSPDGSTVEWAVVPPEDLMRVFRTHRPVCWNCHVTESFRRLYPDLVVDRPAHPPHVSAQSVPRSAGL